MKTKKYFCSALLMMLMSVCLFACGKDPVIELYVANSDANVYEVAPGETLQFAVNVENLDKDDVEYLIVSGAATIDKTSGLLTADVDATVGSTIKVQAKAGDTKSNEISVVVDELDTTSMELSASKSKLAIGGTVTFTARYTANSEAITEYTLNITKGAEYIDQDKLAEGKLRIKSDVTYASIVDKEIIVEAMLNSAPSVRDTVSITVVDEGNVASITALNKTIDMSKAVSSDFKLNAYAYDIDEVPVNVSGFIYAIAEEDKDLASIDENGVITPKGHGTVTVKITSFNDKETTCDVNILVPPTAISIEGLSSHIVDTKEMSYSLVDTLDMNVALSRTDGIVCTNKLKYTFEMLSTSNPAVVDARGDSVATVDADNKITFKAATAGRQVRVTISSDTSIGSASVLSTAEKKTSLVVNVNNGVNVDTVAELMAYAADANRGKDCNIVGDIYLTAEENFGYDGASQHKSLEFRGDRTINGNGYVISNARLPMVMNSGLTESGNDFLRFSPYNWQPFTVNISDLEIVGCTNVTGGYRGELTSHIASNDKALVENEDEYFIARTYRRGLNINGASYEDSIAHAKAYVNGMNLSNVKVTGFDVAIRLSHVVDGLVSNCEVGDCYSNGFESNQNIVEFNNIVLDQVGAFGIEVTPDDMKGQTTANPSGTAGANYDATPVIKMTGTIESKNYNNGASTVYFQNDAMLQLIPTIVNALVTTGVSQFDSGVQEMLVNLAKECMYKTEGSEEYMNFYMLMFVDNLPTGDFPAYNKGNTEGKFVTYESDEANGSVISLTKLLTDAATQGQTYDDYKNYKYLSLDIGPLPLNLLNEAAPSGVYVNLGQVILVNQAYEG